MKRAACILLIIALISYADACAAMYAFQRSLLYYAQPSMVTAPELTMMLPVDGAELVITVRAHDGPKANVYFGGTGEDVSKNLASSVKAFPQRARYLMHYGGYGGSTGKPTEKADDADCLALVGKVLAPKSQIAVFGRGAWS